MKLIISSQLLILDTFLSKLAQVRLRDLESTTGKSLTYSFCTVTFWLQYQLGLARNCNLPLFWALLALLWIFTNENIWLTYRWFNPINPQVVLA